MTICCALFGHKATRGYAGGLPYFKVVLREMDGIGRQHAALEAECIRCGEKFRIGMIHVPRLDQYGNRINRGFKHRW